MKQSKLLLSLFVIFMTVVAFNPAMAQSRKDKKKAQQAEWEYEQRKKELQRQKDLDELELSNTEVDMAIPCLEESRSDDEYYRELGEGEHMRRPQARKLAQKMAHSIMLENLEGEVKGLCTDYSKGTLTSTSDLQQIMESELTKVVTATVQRAVNGCEKWRQDRSGMWHCFYTIQIRRDDMVKDMTEALEKNEKISAEFNREKFRKYAKEYMDNAGENDDKEE